MYRVELLVVRDEGVIVHREEEALVFEVRDVAEMRATGWQWPGVLRPDLNWTTELEQTEHPPNSTRRIVDSSFNLLCYPSVLRAD